MCTTYIIYTCHQLVLPRPRARRAVILCPALLPRAAASRLQEVDSARREDGLRGTEFWGFNFGHVAKVGGATFRKRRKKAAWDGMVMEACIYIKGRNGSVTRARGNGLLVV